MRDYSTLAGLTVGYDIEADGLRPTVVHCICIQEDRLDAPVLRFGPGRIDEAVRLLETAKAVVTHNGIVCDNRVLTRLHKFVPPKTTWDTLVLSRLLFGHLKESVDFELKRLAEVPDSPYTFPGKMIGRHGLEAWGYRLGMHKGDYAKECAAKGIDPWASFNEDMMEYCARDVQVMMKLWQDGIKPRLKGHVGNFTVEVEIKKSREFMGQNDYSDAFLTIEICPDPVKSTKEPVNAGAMIAARIAEAVSDKERINNVIVRNLPGFARWTFASPTRGAMSKFARWKALTERHATKFDLWGRLHQQTMERAIVIDRRGPVDKDNPNGAVLEQVRALTFLTSGPSSVKPIELENYMALEMAELEDNGILLDVTATRAIVKDLEAHKAALIAEIEAFFPARYEPKKWVYKPFMAGPENAAARKLCTFPITRCLFPKQTVYFPKRNLPDGYVREAWGQHSEDGKIKAAKRKAAAVGVTLEYPTYTPPSDEPTTLGTIQEGDRTNVKFAPFKATSRVQVAERLMEMGWVPETFTDSGRPELDDIELEKLSKRFPIAGKIQQLYLIEKRLGQIVKGKQAWLKLVDLDGFIHPTINPCAAVTARATHSNPNISQVPTIKKVHAPTLENPKATRLAWSLEGEWGADCRQVWTVPFGYSMVGADLAGLELRMLAHFLSKFDGGKFAHVLLTQDVHAVNQAILGFANREDAKRFIFALLYGAGDEKLGSIIEPSSAPAIQKIIGRKFRDRLMEGIVGFKDLVNELNHEAMAGALRGLDGRMIPIRHAHAALNTKLQSGGAIVSKYWIRNVNLKLRDELGFSFGRDKDYWMLLWSHDEIQNAVRNCLAYQAARVMEESAILAGEQLNLGIPIKAEAKIGKNWLETH